MIPRCPFCDAPTKNNFESISERPADSFDAHYTGITCSECGEYYEISYRPHDILYWEDGEPKTASTSERPNDRSSTPR